MTLTGPFINSVDFLEFCLRPPRKHCILVMKKRTPSVGWNPILCGDFHPAVSSSLLLPSDSWNKLTWEVNQRTSQGQPASPWKSCLWLLSRLQTQVGEWVTFPHYTFSMVIVTCDFWGDFVCGPLFDLRRTISFYIRNKRRKTVRGFLWETSVSTGGDIWHKCFSGRCWKVAMTVHKNPGKRYCTRKTYTGHKWFFKFLTNDNSCIHYHVGIHVQKQ